MELQNKTRKGSVLVFTLVVLSITLFTTLAIAAATVIERRTSGTTDNSSQAFQAADSGIEKVLEKVYRSGFITLDEFKAPDFICNAGKIIGTIGTGTSKSYELTFKDKSGNPITSCSDSNNKIGSVKSVGFYSDTTRAIETSIAAGSGCFTWVKPTLLNNWINSGTPFFDVEYAIGNCVTGGNIVYLRGVADGQILGANLDGCIFNLPIGARPAQQVEFGYWTGNPSRSGATVLVEAGGCVKIRNGATMAVAKISFDGLFFDLN